MLSAMAEMLGLDPVVFKIALLVIFIAISVVFAILKKIIHMAVSIALVVFVFLTLVTGSPKGAVDKTKEYVDRGKDFVVEQAH